MTSRNWTRGVLAALAVTTAACSTDQAGPLSPLSPNEVGLETLSKQYVVVCKYGPAGTYSFEASATGGYLYPASFTLAAGECLTIWGANTVEEGPSSVTVTEILGPGMQVDSIYVVPETQAGPGVYTKYTGTNTATATGLDWYNGARFKFWNSETPDTPGGQGCTPGFWKQEQHFPFWTSPYAPSTLFSAVFENAFPGMTLLQVASLGGGGLNALGRHTVAALLNAASADVDYGYSVQEVIDGFNAVFPGGDYEGLKGDFEYENELGCGLGMSMLQ